MEYSNEELTQRVKQLEGILLQLLTRIPNLRAGICVNMSLHAWPEHAEDHPPTLQVPHYVWAPEIDWGTDQIHLHPGNKPRA